MNVLILGLYAEGRTDELFLPALIQRTSQRILIQHDRMDIYAEPVLIIEKDRNCWSLDQCILQAAREAQGYDALVVHSDGDDRDHKQTLHERFYPGYELVRQTAENVCKHLVPIIPIRMVEAWMLADPEALRSVLKTKLSTYTLGAPGKAKLVEADRYPKDTLYQVVQKAYPHQSRQWKRMKAELYEKLAPTVNLDRLEQVPSYKQFVTDLTAVLKTLNLIQ